MLRPKPRVGSGRRRSPALLLAGFASLPVPAAGSELVTALPHEFVVGSARGTAVAPGVDASGSRHAMALPGADEARVAWQRHIPGGVGTNLLVDAEGRVFAAGPTRVTQLGADGVMQYSRLAGYSGPIATALLADGARAVLTREGRVQAWSASGAVVFDIALEAPVPSSSSTLLPLPDGGAIASVGAWLFEIDATRSVRSYASLPADIQHARVIDGRALVVDEQGRVFEWDRSDLPRPIGAFGSPLSSVIADAGTLIGLTSRRSIERLDRSDGSLRELARLDPPGALELASIAPGRWVVMKSDGTWFVVPADVPPPISGQHSRPDPPSHLELVTDSAGAVAWWGVDIPLHLETAPGLGRELDEVRCSTPISLVPAGRFRIAAACSSGAIWLVDQKPPVDG
jgi:hypothetical protein